MSTRLVDRVGPAVRPRIPVAVLPALVGLRARRSLSSAKARAEAAKQMGLLMGGEGPPADIEQLTDAYIRFMKWRGELRWHPELITRQPVEGVDHVRTAAAHGRGVVLNFMHHGFFDGLFGSLARHDIACSGVATAALFDEHASPTIRQHMALVAMGGPPLNAAVGSRGMIDALGSGALLAIAVDFPGSAPMRFLGRDLYGSSGAARIAYRADAPVVVVTSHREGTGRLPASRLKLAEPLYPADFDSPRSLLEAMLERHEHAILDWPEAYFEPTGCWHVENPVTDG